MAFGGNFGAAGNLVPFALFRTLDGEAGAGYDADGNLILERASGSLYTPRRIDTLLISGLATEAGGSVLAAVTVGASGDPADADVGQLVTSVAAANQHGLPANFGLGRGRWGAGRGVNRLFCHAIDTALDVGAGPANLASVQTTLGNIGLGDDVAITIRNLHIQALDYLLLRPEFLHSIQG